MALICRVMQHENYLEERGEWVGSDVFDKQWNKETYEQTMEE